jgi:hypothetical protein
MCNNINKYTKKCNSTKIYKDGYCRRHFNHRKYYTNECCICLEQDEKLDRLSCGHWLHKKCFLSYNKDFKCPTCKEVLKLNRKENDQIWFNKGFVMMRVPVPLIEGLFSFDQNEE